MVAANPDDMKTAIERERRRSRTDVADEDDFGVGRDVLGEERPLLVTRQELVLAGGVRFTGRGGGQVEQVKPSFRAHGDHQVLTGTGSAGQT